MNQKTAGPGGPRYIQGSESIQIGSEYEKLCMVVAKFQSVVGH